MKKIAIFNSEFTYNPELELEKMVNLWIKENNIHVIDVKFSVYVTDGYSRFSAMVIYESPRE